MSEEIKPKVLPGNLITGPGLYESRCLDIVPITGWKDGWWITESDGTLDWYGSNGSRRFYEGSDADRWQLLHWVGPLPATEPEPETTSEQLAEIEGQGDTIQVREGRWRTRAGDIRNVTPTPISWLPKIDAGYPWWDSVYQATWTQNGRYYSNYEESKLDLVEYLGPIEPQIEPQIEPVPQAESDAELRIRLLKHANDSQAETIGRLLTEARDLNMEIGGLEQQLSERQARIRDLETMHSAATQAVVDAGKQNDALRLQVQNRQQEYERQKARIEFLETLDAGNAVAICDYRAQVGKLQGLVDNARRQLEAAADEISELRKSLDNAEKQLDQKDAQIRDLPIDLDAAEQIPKPLTDDQRELIWNEATKFAGQQVVGWLQPLVHALSQQPDERFLSFMALTLAALPDIVPRVLGYEEDERGEVAEE